MFNIIAAIQFFALNVIRFPNSWKDTLPAMLIGMLGFFIVIGVIILFTYALNKATASKKDDE